jgi:ATP synthase protein I
MPENGPAPTAKIGASAERLMREVGSRERRMLRRRKQGPPNIWRSVGLIGLVGWSVALPMLIGIAIGTWIDHAWPSRFSWTLMLLVGGLAGGCASAWDRIRKEQEDR